MLALPRNCPITMSLLGINVAIFVAQFLTQEALTNAGVLYGPFVQNGEYWRIITSGFMHGSVLHILFNMYLLYMMGPELESNLGKARFGLMYFGALVGGSLAVLAFGFAQPTLGASGAVLGLASSMFVILWGRGFNPSQSPFFGLVILNLALPLFIPTISFWGHFGGVVGGAIMAFAMVWLPEKNTSGKQFKNLSLGALLLIVLLVACVLVV